jgi:hypothetical protein
MLIPKAVAIVDQHYVRHALSFYPGITDLFAGSTRFPVFLGGITV